MARIVLTVALLAAAVIIEHTTQLPTWQLLLVYMVPWLLAGYDTLKEAAEGLAHGEAFNEHFLMSVATIGALCIGFLPGAENQFAEAVVVMLFFQVGEMFEGYAEGKSRESISHLMDIRPDIAHLVTAGTGPASASAPPLGGWGATADVNPAEVAVGQVIEIRPGEKVPLDGIIIEGNTTLNTMALTGESVPRDAAVGDEVLSGCVNVSGVVRVRTTKSFGESTASKIIDLVENAAEHKSQSEAFITRFARIYTPVVVIAAVLLAIVPPLVLTIANNGQWSMVNGQWSMVNGQWSMVNGQWSMVNGQWSVWLYRALMFLVVSCPCALVISVPLTFFGGIGGASRKGILVKGANYLDALAKVDTVVFDKTGTLTRGQFSVTAVHPEQLDAHELLHLAAHVEHFTTHPIGAALRDAFPDEATDGCTVENVTEVPGKGITAKVNLQSSIFNPQSSILNLQSSTVSVGNTKMMDAVGAKWHDCHHTGTIIHVAVNGEYAGHIVINDTVKADSSEAITKLKTLGVSHITMLTGDRKETAAAVAAELGIDDYHAELMPDDKAKFIDDLRFTDLPLNSDGGSQIVNRKSVNRKSVNRKLCFVGDGINDAPVLALADVGIAMGGLGSDAAIEAADVVIMDDHPSKVATAIAIARRTLAIARQNVWFAIGIKLAVLLLAATGMATMWMAVFADVGVTVLAVLNAMRALKTSIS